MLVKYDGSGEASRKRFFIFELVIIDMKRKGSKRIMRVAWLSKRNISHAI